MGSRYRAGILGSPALLAVLLGGCILIMGGALLAYQYASGRQRTYGDSYAPPAPTYPSVTPVTDQTLQEVDRLTASPDDPLKPASVRGVSDKELVNIPTDQIKALIEKAYRPAKMALDPHYLFGLGRAALLHGDNEFARELLTEAARRGSAAAHAYLAQMIEDPADREAHIRAAAAGNFGPARRWLEENTPDGQNFLERTAEALFGRRPSAPEPIDFAAFKYGMVVKALHEGRIDDLRANMWTSANFIASANDAIAEYCRTRLVMAGDKAAARCIKPGLSQAALNKVVRTKEGIDQMVAMGLDRLAIVAEGLQSAQESGGSFSGATAKIVDAAMGGKKYVPIDQFKGEAIGDGNMIAALYNGDPESFDRIFNSMERFAAE